MKKEKGMEGEVVRVVCNIEGNELFLVVLLWEIL